MVSSFREVSTAPKLDWTAELALTAFGVYQYSMECYIGIEHAPAFIEMQQFFTIPNDTSA